MSIGRPSLFKRVGRDEATGIHVAEHLVDEKTDQQDNGVAAVVEIDGFRVLGISAEDTAFYTSFPPERRKRLTRKIDVRLIPLLTILYLASQIDRSNIGNAKIEGLDRDLNLTGTQYNVALAIFSIPYILCEVPSNMILKRFKRPSLYVGMLILLWGITMTSMGLVRNFSELAAVRFLLGIFEAGFYPAAVYICSTWYLPTQLATRISIFFSTAALSGAFSGLLAAAIAQMDGVGGYSGWRWIFLLEGLTTVLLAIVCLVFLIDSPALSRRWLDPEEIRLLELQAFIVQGGIQRYQEKETWASQRKDMIGIFCTWRLYVLSLISFASSSCSYGTKFTLPSITRAMGFSTTNAQLLSAPPYIAAALAALVAGRLSDRLRWRMPFIAIACTLLLIGYSIVFSLRNDLATRVGPAYTGIVIAVTGIYSVIPIISAWNANNLAPAGRRAVGVAYVGAVGILGSILGSFMYLDSEAPAYPTGFGLSFSLGAMGLVSTLLLEWSYVRANRKRAKLSVGEVRAKYSEAELLDMGDRSPLFRYVL